MQADRLIAIGAGETDFIVVLHCFFFQILIPKTLIHKKGNNSHNYFGSQSSIELDV